jgi:ankyrin repeat protein
MPKTYGEIKEEVHRQLLLRQDAANRQLLSDAFSGDLRAVEAALQAGGRVYTVGPDGKQPLHLAAGSNRPEVVKALLNAGADVNAKDRLGDTALHEVATSSNVHASETARLLLDAGANVKARNKQGKTPIDAAITSGNHHLAKVVEEFKSANDRLNARFGRRARSQRDQQTER